MISLKAYKNIFLLLSSVVLVFVAFWSSDLGEVITAFKAFPIWVFFGIFLLFSLNLRVSSLRLGRVLAYLGIELPRPVISMASIHGHFASLFFISLLGHVSGRYSVLKRHGVSSIIITSSVLVERIALCFVSGVLCFCGAYWLLGKGEVLKFLDETSLFYIALTSILSLLGAYILQPITP